MLGFFWGKKSQPPNFPSKHNIPTIPPTSHEKFLISPLLDGFEPLSNSTKMYEENWNLLFLRGRDLWLITFMIYYYVVFVKTSVERWWRLDKSICRSSYHILAFNTLFLAILKYISCQLTISFISAFIDNTIWYEEIPRNQHWSRLYNTSMKKKNICSALWENLYIFIGPYDDSNDDVCIAGGRQVGE